MSGVELVEALVGANPTIAVVVISGEENETTKKRARDSGANDFIGKTADARD